jgi:hypothetical protein
MSYFPSQSGEVAISVLQAYSPSLSISTPPPSTGKAGQSFTVAGKVYGTEGGYQWWPQYPSISILFDGSVIASGNGDVNGNFSISATIPSNASTGKHTIRVQFNAGYYTVDYSGPKDSEYPKYVYCSGAYSDYTITIGVETAITISVSPVKVTPGSKINITGKLTRTDTGAGLAGMTVQIYWREPSTQIGTVTTASDGSYSFTYTIPSGTAAGTYYVKAVFPGYGLYLSSSTEKTLEVSALPVELSWWTLTLIAGATGAILLGGIIAYNELSKRR